MNIDQVLEIIPKTARSVNFEFVLRLLNERFGDTPLNFVETGIIRQVTDTGDGWSTLVWQAYAHDVDGQVWAVDIDEKAIDACSAVLNRRNKNDHVALVCDDSLNFLKNFDKEIHLLYLDSYDTDITKNCCIHQAREAQLGFPKVVQNGIIMLDDVFTGGKADFSIPYLKSNGWNVIRQAENQAILSRI